MRIAGDESLPPWLVYGGTETFERSGVRRLAWCDLPLAFAATPPTFTTVAPVTKLVPVMVMAVLPAIGPELGATVEMVGALP